MVNIFGEATQNGGVGRRGPRGKRGRDGKGDDYYENYMRHSKFFQHFTWDIDFTPNHWIDGYLRHSKRTLIQSVEQIQSRL